MVEILPFDPNVKGLSPASVTVRGRENGAGKDVSWVNGWELMGDVIKLFTVVSYEFL